jgi:hypothetical protein
MHIPIRECLIAYGFVLLCSGCAENTKQAFNEVEQENARLLLQLDSLSLRLDSVLNAQSTPSSGAQADILSESDIDFFRRRGLSHPVEDIKADLTRNSKLIPVKGSLGGAMQFYKERIHVLNRRWVLAYFEDGHSAGEMLLEYQVGTNGTISWKVLTTSMM